MKQNKYLWNENNQSRIVIVNFWREQKYFKENKDETI